jgi:hypothetical protein
VFLEVKALYLTSLFFVVIIIAFCQWLLLLLLLLPGEMSSQ